MDYRKNFLVSPGKKFSLAKVDPGDKGNAAHGAAREQVGKNRDTLDRLQSLLWAEKKRSILIVLQGLDGAGKDGTIEHVLGELNPQGVTVTGFGVPTREEAAHDFLWRVHPHAPGRGYIAIFNRSHYEDVLSPRVHKNISKTVCRERYQRIREFEQLLADNDTLILKFFLHISKEEQLDRFAARLQDKTRNWKISDSDYSERPYWDDYMAGYEEAIRATSTKIAPWYVIPANHKWFRDLAISQILVDAMQKMKMSYPEPRADLQKIRREYHQAVVEEQKKR